MAQAKARHKDWKDRFFNVGFIVDPDGNSCSTVVAGELAVP